MKQYKRLCGTSPRIYDLLTINDGGQPTALEFHGTDRTLSHPATLEADGPWQGWLLYGNGSRLRYLLPDGTLDTRWHEIAESEMQTAAPAPAPAASQPTAPLYTQAEVEAIIAARLAEAERNRQAALARRREQARQRRAERRQQREAEAALLALACQNSDDHSTATSTRRSTTQPLHSHQGDGSETTSRHSWLKPLGLAAAACLALFVIWNTGLLIPLGLIGLATGGILK